MKRKKGISMDEAATLKVWRELFELAGKIKKLEPWTRYADRELFAVELPDTREMMYFGFIGMYGTCYGICGYSGDDGLRGHFRACEADNNPLSGGAEWIMLEHDALTCYFSDRDQVSASQKKIIKTLGLKFRGSSQWTNFTAYQSKMYPDELNIAEAQKLVQGYRLLIVLLEQVLGGTFGRKFDFAEHFPLCRLDASTGTPVCSLMNVPQLDLSYPIVKFGDQTHLKSLVHLKRLPCVLLIDLHYLGIPLGESRRERAGAGLVFVVVDEKSTMILNMQIVDPKQDRNSQCLGWFVDYLSQNGLPKCVKVRKEAVWAMLANTCRVCGIQVDDDCSEDFIVLDDCIDEMLSRFRG